MQNTGPPPHGLPAPDGLGGTVRLPENLPVERENGIAPEHKNPRISRQRGSDGPRLHPGKRQAQLRGVISLYYGLVNATDLDINVNAGGGEKGPPGRAGRSEHQMGGDVGLHGSQRYKPGSSGGRVGAAAR
ncbi:hypothetical protein Aau02nite_84880 [Amorphoplanes auranticolor]|uniref:Uncharacterized protein n=1 Tax=Actinoplanes auranticolor TaxID=47988 RepID=A0A919SUQ1_9ACTN|nr:hypothetical protein Aau02nite_84880 [Actinoplanes auranticolor]